MKFAAFFLTITFSIFSYAVVDKAPKCDDYFSVQQTDGRYQRVSNGLVQDPLTGLTGIVVGLGKPGSMENAKVSQYAYPLKTHKPGLPT